MRKHKGTPLIFRVLLWILILLVLAVMIFGICLQALVMYREADPQGFTDTFGQTFGSWRRTAYDLNLSDPALKAKIESLNISSQEVAETQPAIDWLATVKPNNKLTIGISLAIYARESGNGVNIGEKLASETTCVYPYDANFCAGEKRARDGTSEKDPGLLAYWESFKITSWDPVAAAHIIKDENGHFVDYRGGGAGEIGPDQEIASTLWNISCPILKLSSDIRIRSCDVFDEQVSTYGKMALLTACGYNASDPFEKRLDALTPCWNADRQYVSELLTRADQIDAALSGTVLPVNKLTYYEGPTELNSLLNEYSYLLTAVGVDSVVGSSGYTGSQEWLLYPIAQEDLSSSYASTGYMSQTYGTLTDMIGRDGKRIVHTGNDYPCSKLGALVLTPASGHIVVVPNSTWVYDTSGGANMVFVDHGNGLWSGYFHLMASPYGDLVQQGQAVEKGQPIGRCGSTGNSTGRHVHFEIFTCPPSGNFNTRCTVDPSNYLGKFVEPVQK
jgi:murein DD-endopeptidase MepM/ murein hydrolase activator NlpD